MRPHNPDPVDPKKLFGLEQSADAALALTADLLPSHPQDAASDLRALMDAVGAQLGPQCVAGAPGGGRRAAGETIGARCRRMRFVMLPATRHYYSTQPFLAWCVGHYFGSGRHYANVGSPFHPYKRKNPQSSNPYVLYGAFYGPWYDVDPNDRNIRDFRLSLARGIRALSLSTDTAARLRRCVRKVDVKLFLPVVYRVDVTTIPPARLIIGAGSGAVGSEEYLITDLDESEFDVLFADECAEDAEVRILADGALAPDHALRLLEARCA